MRRPHRTAAKNVYEPSGLAVAHSDPVCCRDSRPAYARRVSNRSSVLSFWPHAATVSVRKRVIEAGITRERVKGRSGTKTVRRTFCVR